MADPDPTGDDGRELCGGAGSFPIIPFWEVVTGTAPPERFRGKVVFVGNLHPSFRDFHLTPFIRPRTEASVGVQLKRATATPGVEINASEAYLTMLFSDIRGFTSMSEAMDPAEVSTLLNEYLGAMPRVIFEHGGTPDKFMGDAVMAFWGDPIPQPDHALRAVRAAVVMRAKTEDLGAEWQRQGRRPIAAGIGINTGRVVVGNPGSSDFIDYTVIGDDVNLACRLEQVARAGQILLSEATLKDVEGKVIVKALAPVAVKGKAEPVPVWELLGLVEDTT